MTIQKIMAVLICSLGLFSCSKSDDPTFNDTQGNKVQLSHLKGKWIIINYWAEWCPSCVKEIPELNAFSKKHSSDNVVVYGVDYDKLLPQEVQIAADKAGIHYPVITKDPNPAWHLGDVSVLPVTFILDQQGKVVKTIMGPNTEQSLTEVLATLQHEQA